MRRNLITCMAALGLAASVAGVASGGLEAPAATVTVEPGGADAFGPERARVSLDNAGAPTIVRWEWGPGGGGTDAPHDVDHARGLFSTPLRDAGTYERDFSAGTFRYLCTIHAGMEGTVAVEPAHFVADGARLFRVRWAGAGAQTGDAYDVRFRVGDRRWRTWKTDTRAKSAVFGRRGNPVPVRCGRRYSFQARSQKLRNPRKRSGWSPVHTYLACD